MRILIFKEQSFLQASKFFLFALPYLKKEGLTPHPKNIILSQKPRFWDKKKYFFRWEVFPPNFI